jgi:ABC-2 type transport system permease protein
MRKILVIARREYNASVKTKAFIISLVVMPIFMGGSIVVQMLLKDVRDTKTKSFAVVDRTEGEKLAPLLVAALAINKNPDDRTPDDKAAIDRVTRQDPELIRLMKIPMGSEQFQAALKEDLRLGALAALGKTYDGRPAFRLERVKPASDAAEMRQQRFDLSERVRKGELFGFFEIGRDVEESLWPNFQRDDRFAIRYQTNSPTYEEFPKLVEVAIGTMVKRNRSEHYHFDPKKIEKISFPVPREDKGLSQKNAQGEIEEAPEQNRLVFFFLPFGFMMLMFMVIMIGATPLMQGVIEEKMQRIAEVLLGSVQPFELMMGKLIGMVGVALTLAAVYLAGGYWAAHHFGFAEHLPPELLLWFLLFQILAVLMFGSLFIAVGAACTDTKEAQTMMFPVMMLAMVPMFVWLPVVQDPNSSFATGISFFPFATPLLMVLRLAVPPGIALWQPVLGVGIVLATTILCVYAAGRIFRVGILMQGKGAKLSDLVRWVFRG